MDGEGQTRETGKEIRPDLHAGDHNLRPVDRVHGFLLLFRRF